MTYVSYFPLRRGLWVRMARKACWLAYCKIWPDVVEHPGTSATLHFTYYILRHTKSFSGILSSKVVWVLERRDRFLCLYYIPLNYTGVPVCECVCQVCEKLLIKMVTEIHRAPLMCQLVEFLQSPTYSENTQYQGCTKWKFVAKTKTKKLHLAKNRIPNQMSFLKFFIFYMWIRGAENN